MRRLLVYLGVAGAIAASMVAIYAVGGLRLIDDAVHDVRMRSLDIEASGDIVIVEIDAESLRRLGQWPWPRGHHAMVLQRLLDAGATRVGLDISFSSASDAAQDARLAGAAAAAGDRLYLPVFQQHYAQPDGSTGMLVDRPLPNLFPQTPLASINVRPDSDGIVRQLPVVARIEGALVPFMATALRAGADYTPDMPYFIDFGIDPNSLPRLSYADVLVGQFDESLVMGRSVLVGATAIELGDVLAVPRWGNLAGPLVIATGFETQALGRALGPLGDWWFMLALCFAAALAPGSQGTVSRTAFVVPALIQLVGLAGISEWLYVSFALKLDIAPVAAALVLAYGIEVGRIVRIQALRIAAQNREAEQRQALLRSVVATSIDAVVITDRRGVILLANPACLTVFGYEASALVGREILDLINPYDRITGHIRGMTRPGGGVPELSYPVELEGIRSGGTAVELELSLADVGDDDDDANSSLISSRHFIAVFHDVTEQRWLESMRRLALQAQVDAERAKANFLATASHELRTPLNHIQGFSALLGAGIGGQLSEQQRGYVTDIETAAGNLFEIVTDILSYSEQANADSPLKLDDMTAATLIDAARGPVDSIAESRQVAVKVSGDSLGEILHVDRESMVRAVMHVLRNAVQFSPSDAQVEVSATQDPDQKGVTIAIADRGQGMSAEQIEHVLTEFGQVEGAHARSHGGLGVGLNLARACLERHGGTLLIESTVGEGTCVKLCIPWPRPAETAVAAA